MRFFVEICYLGANFRGWQRQPDVPTVQETLEDCMSKVLKRHIVCIGCGRTDAKVNASQYFFHFDSEIWDFDLKFRLNKTLPDDISILNILPVEGYPHAQLSAVSRTYDYLVHTKKDPFLSQLSVLYPEEFDTQLMLKAVNLIPQYNDFQNLCLCLAKHSSTVCDVSSAKLFVRENGQMLRFQITANRFLQGMVRIIAQGIMDVGTRQISVEEFESYLNLKQKPVNIRVGYPQGLYLSGVKYPFLQKPNEATFFNLVTDAQWTEIK